jgi:hypothetical protein
MKGNGDYPVKQNKPDTENRVLHVLPHMMNLKKKKKDMKIEEGIGRVEVGMGEGISVGKERINRTKVPYTQV